MVEDPVVVQRFEGRKAFAQARKGILDLSVELSDFDHHDLEIVVGDLLIEARYAAFDHLGIVHGIEHDRNLRRFCEHVANAVAKRNI